LRPARQVYLRLALAHEPALAVGVAGRQPEHEVAEDEGPTAKIVSQTMRSQRSVSISPVWRNSAERAYYIPYSTEAHVCINPMGSSTISSSPTSMPQKEYFIGHSFQALPGWSARRQKSMSPMPSIP
jgi:hypothetical protein